MCYAEMLNFRLNNLILAGELGPHKETQEALEEIEWLKEFAGKLIDKFVVEKMEELRKNAEEIDPSD